MLTESEIWPNFIRIAKKMGIPLFLINARVSDRSAPRYKAARWFFGEVLSCFTRIFAQSDLDKARLVAAGAPEDKVEVTGSFKFDVARRNEAKERELLAWICGGETPPPQERTTGGGGVPPPRILLGGSTWPGEDEVLLKIYKRLLETQTLNNSKTQTLLVIAPRHFEKADAVEVNIRKHGFACIRRSRGDKVKVRGEGGQRKELNSTVDLNLQPQPVYLADTTGELMGLYGIADVVFVGKSLCAHGSQNMIEPCLCGKPTLVGPYTENFRPVMSDLLASDAIIQVKDAEDLEERIVELFGSSDLRGRDAPAPCNSQALQLGERAKAAVEKRLGVVAKCVSEIRGAL